jgi:hypothetical protein
MANKKNCPGINIGQFLLIKYNAKNLPNILGSPPDLIHGAVGVVHNGFIVANMSQIVK